MEYVDLETGARVYVYALNGLDCVSLWIRTRASEVTLHVKRDEARQLAATTDQRIGGIRLRPIEGYEPKWVLSLWEDRTEMTLYVTASEVEAIRALLRSEADKPLVEAA
jgi:hypothetical protein